MLPVVYQTDHLLKREEWKHIESPKKRRGGGDEEKQEEVEKEELLFGREKVRRGKQ